MLRSRWIRAFAIASAVVFIGCGDDETTDGGESKGCTVGTAAGCAPDLVCEEVLGAAPACFAPLTVVGRVIDAETKKAIEGARVVARDANDAAISRVAITGSDGAYSLVVPAMRDKTGKPVGTTFTLRADALGYLTFPKAPRVALPIDTADAAGEPPVLDTAATDIALFALPNAAGLGSVSGRVLADHAAGTLVVAGGATGVADTGGDYVVFNVPAGPVTVEGYASGLELEPAQAEVVAAKDTPGVDLASAGPATAIVSGKVEIVNPGDGKDTSVILVVESTFDENAARGEAPRGLRVGGVSGAFSIPGVPSGRYVVLAAFENDFLVRDPDTTIGGTEIVHIEVSGKSLEIAESFKVTGALGVVSPGKNDLEAVGAKPTFEWEDDSSEDHYELRVFDAFGTLIWEKLDVPGVSGGGTVSQVYDGTETLEPGMIYQFRATSIGKASGGKPAAPISQTEDLRGVFIVE